MQNERSLAIWIVGLLLGAIGLVLAGGGAWLLLLGGSAYYLLAGVAMLAVAWLVLRWRAAALPAYAALLAATLGWGLWEVGLDWWPLAARGGLSVLLGVALLLPPVTRRLQASAWRGGGLALGGVLVASVGVAIAAILNDPHRIAGRAPEPRPAATADASVPPGEWHAYGRTPHGQRWSPLDLITPQNVARLEVAWTHNTGDIRGAAWEPQETTFQATPLKIGNRLFLCTPHQSVIALDATSGAQIWRTALRLRDGLALQHLTCRGLGFHPGAAPAEGRPPARVDPARVASARQAVPDLPIASDDQPVQACTAKLYMPTADGRLVALDPGTGRVCGDFGGGTGQVNLWANMPNVRPGAYYSTSPPVVTNGVIVIGGTVLDNVSTQEQSGVIRGYDAETGALLWNWDAGNPGGTEPVAAGAAYVANSPNAWAPLSADPGLGLVYVPLGNQPPDQWGGNRSAEVERFSSSIVALEIATGRLRWVFQTVHHDLWDYDVPAQPTLIDLTVNGTLVPALVQPTKQGEIFVLDRRSGEPVLPVREVPAPQGAARGDHTAPTQPVSALSFAPPRLTGADTWGATIIDQMVCRIRFHRMRYEGRYTPPSEGGTLVHPGNFGVFNWGGVAVDPTRGIVFATPAWLAFTSRLVPRPDDRSLVINETQPAGALPALNENFGAPFGAAMGPFTSFLGIPCHAPPWGRVAAADLATGEVIWMHRNGTVRDLTPLPLPFRMGVPSLGGPIVTAGGLAFLSGTVDYFVRGYDLRDGSEVWRARLPAGGQATPMTYLGEDGRQYLLVIAGGHGSLGTKAGDAVIAYALPRGG